MQPTSFIAASAEEALAQIRARLGPEAVVLNVRPLPANGLARIWQKPMIEVLAYKPEAAISQTAPICEALAEFGQQLRAITQHVQRSYARLERQSPGSEAEEETWRCAEGRNRSSGHWRVGEVLLRAGLLPAHVENVLDQLHSLHGAAPPPTLGEELALAQAALAKSWRTPGPIAPHSMHVLVGPPGSGKTTCLCKWLARLVLADGRLARVWRLDGTTANMAECLTVYCEILGVPAQRRWLPDETLQEDIGFIDLPGVDWRKDGEMRQLDRQIQEMGCPHVHLVLNGAYDMSVLLAQQRAFSSLSIEELMVTHLDEETRWGKVWNLALGTNCSIRHFSTGQNIPGDFCQASAEMIFSRQFACK